ncbi:hypothetical protein DESC_710025 [Desulfosarcina cetonica]|nr:hypothetical protein DESC_710025 [Desulfosarcina cetonica]
MRRSWGGLITGADGGGQATPRGELAGDFHELGREHLDQIVENAVGNVLVKHADVAELQQVVFQGFEFDDEAIRRIADVDGAEIGQAGHGADRGEFRLGNGDDDVPFALVGVFNGIKHLGGDHLGLVHGVANGMIIGFHGWLPSMGLVCFLYGRGLVCQMFCCDRWFQMLLAAMPGSG